MQKGIKYAIRSLKGRKESGSSAVAKFLPLLIVIIVVAMITVQYAGYTKVLGKKDEISLTMRKYIIRMETNGYLTSEDKKAMTKELQDIGMTSLDFTGTTINEVKYGEIVYLKLKGELEVKSYNILALLKGEWNTVTIAVNETRSSTSQR